MKRLDYLISCLKNEGIYCYMDMFTYRRFKTGDGVENAIDLQDAAKPYCIFSRKLIDLQKKLAYDLWTHVNPYTGLAYKDDPVFVMAEIVNESELFHKRTPIVLEPYATEFRAQFTAWIHGQGIEFDPGTCDLNDNTITVLAEFKSFRQAEYFREMILYLKEIGVRIPLTTTNHSSMNYRSIMTQQQEGEFVDNHAYFSSLTIQEFLRNKVNRGLSADPNGIFFATLASTRALGKPMFIGEWDIMWPNDYRGESPILLAAVGALQGWSGMAIHTYSYTALLNEFNTLGKEVSCAKIGNTPYRVGTYSTWNDPSKFGLFYHAAIITRRGDISQAAENIEVVIADLEETSKQPFALLPEKHRVGLRFDNDTLNRIAGQGEKFADAGGGSVTSDNGQLYRNWEKKYGTIDSPMTKCAYGMLGSNSPVELDGLRIKCGTDYAVIAMSSLTDEPIYSSDNILLTAVGRTMNTGETYDENGVLVDYGRPPVMIEVIEAEIELTTGHAKQKIWAVSAEGLYIGTVPAICEDGKLKFKLGENTQSMYYLVQTE